MKPKVIAQDDSNYIIQMDKHNVIIVDTHRGYRTDLMWEKRLCKLDWDFQEPKEPVPSVEELLSYPLYKPFTDKGYADAMRYSPGRDDWLSDCPPVLKSFQR